MAGRKCDSELGERVHQHLIDLGLETLIRKPSRGDALIALSNGVTGFLKHMGLNIEDPSLADTPLRVGEMFAWELCAGLMYESFPKCTTVPNGEEFHYVPEEGDPKFDRWTGRKGSVDEMVMIDTINTISLCEHHFQTIHGVTHIAYIPRTKLLGLSKFARVTDFFARRPQVQERMTEQIYAALAYILETPDVAIQQVCVHNCMRARGAMDPHSKTTTSKVGGRFKDNPPLRQEFLHGIR